MAQQPTEIAQNGLANGVRSAASPKDEPLTCDRRLTGLVQGDPVGRLGLGGDLVQRHPGREFDERHATQPMLVDRKHAEIGDDEVDDLPRR